MPVERKRALAGRHHMDRAAKALEPQQRPDASPLEDKTLAVATIGERHIGDVHHRFLRWRCRHPTLPSRLIEMSFCPSTANSIGSCCSTSLTKPLTTSATASSAEKPRCMQ